MFTCRIFPSLRMFQSIIHSKNFWENTTMWHVVYKEEQNIREKYKKSSKKISVYGTTCGHGTAWY